MTPAMRQFLARQPFEQKVEKVGQLIALSRQAKAFQGIVSPPLSQGSSHRVTSDYVQERAALFAGETVESLFQQATALAQSSKAS